MKNGNDMIFYGKRCLRLFSRFFLVGAFLLFQLNALAQQRTVAGTVTGADGSPLAGVTVMVKGTTVGTTTGIDGKYSLSVPANAQTLVFSFMGMQTQEIPVGAGNAYNVTLKESVVGLEEVVVIGYGTAKKSDLTGSVARVAPESYKTQNVKQISEMLTGTVAGFNADQGTGAAGGTTLEIRGPTSLSAGTNPLIVLDGVIFNGSLADINPNDIASIDILKDASSSAVFGSKAASGVILVTTSKGSVGKPVINFAAKVGLSNLLNKDFQPFPDYLSFRRDFMRTMNYPQPDYYYWDPNDLKSYPTAVTIDQWRNAGNNPQADNTQEWYSRLNLFTTEKDALANGTNVNWYPLVFQTGISQDYDLSMSGGTKDVRYYWSLGYLDNSGILRGDVFSAIRSRLNLDGNVTPWLRVGINSQFTLRDESSVPVSIGNYEYTCPYSKVFNDDGTVNWYPNGYTGGTESPLINFYGQQRIRKLNNLFASLFAEIKLPFGFVWKTSFQPRIQNTKDYNFWNKTTTTGVQSYIGGYGRRQDISATEWMMDNMLKWNKEFGVHVFDLTLLQNAEKNLGWESRYDNQNFQPTDALSYHGMAFGSIPSVTSTDTKATGTALMARLNYTLMNKYLLTLSFRQDGYSAFGQQNPTANFPAAALGWKISDENFWKIPAINRMKIRLSYGVNGNRDIGTYAALSQLNSNTYYNGSSTEMGTFASTLSNPGLRWERTAAFNVGLDMGMFSDRIDITIDAYDSKTDDLLMTRQLPRITGFSSIMANLGRLGNKGFELTLNTVNVNQPNVTWKSSVVFSLNRNKIIKLFGDIKTFTLLGVEQTGPVPDFTNQWFPGKPLDIIWDYNLLGIWQNEEKDAAAVYKEFPGYLKALDVNGDGKYSDMQDKQFIGHKTPQYRVGFRNDVTFLKHFTASVFIRADLGHMGNYSPVILEGHSTYDRRNSWYRPAWTPTNPDNEWPSLGHYWDTFGGGINTWKPMSFVRIQDVSLSYDLPSAYAQKVKLSSLKVFVSARNLVTFTKWPGWDPEVVSGSSIFAPMPRTFTFGVNLSL
jgi:TonB-dependent starch-binding outer membrane protein SusC